MRVLLALFQIGVLLACPALCQAEEAGHAPDLEPAGAGAPCDPAGPDSCPDEGGDCVCGGAVQADPARVIGPGLDAPSPADFRGFAPCRPAPLALPKARLASDGRPPGRSWWPDAPSVRALLQNFRC